MAEVDGKAVCVVVPSDREVSMKKLAAAFGGKSAAMMKPAIAEKATGYVVGGISPFGQKKKVPTAIEEAAMSEAFVYMNGGQRGLQVRLSPVDAQRVWMLLLLPSLQSIEAQPIFSPHHLESRQHMTLHTEIKSP